MAAATMGGMRSRFPASRSQFARPLFLTPASDSTSCWADHNSPRSAEIFASSLTPWEELRAPPPRRPDSLHPVGATRSPAEGAWTGNGVARSASVSPPTTYAWVCAALLKTRWRSQVLGLRCEIDRAIKICSLVGLKAFTLAKLSVTRKFRTGYRSATLRRFE